MTLKNYIEILQEIQNSEGNDVEVKTQTLTHTWDAERPSIKVAHQDGERYLVLNP